MLPHGYLPKVGDVLRRVHTPRGLILGRTYQVLEVSEQGADFSVERPDGYPYVSNFIKNRDVWELVKREHGGIPLVSSAQVKRGTRLMRVVPYKGDDYHIQEGSIYTVIDIDGSFIFIDVYSKRQATRLFPINHSYYPAWEIVKDGTNEDFLFLLENNPI